MTAQATDYVIFKGKEFDLIDTEKNTDLHLTVKSKENEKNINIKFSYLHSTACYRGYVAQYSIRDSELFGCYFNNDLPDEGEDIEDKLVKSNYTGAIIIGRNYSRGFPFNSDFIDSFIYAEEAYEIHFTDGKVDDVVDLKEVIESFEEGKDNYNKYIKVGENFNFDAREEYVKSFLKYKYNDEKTYKWLNS